MAFLWKILGQNWQSRNQPASTRKYVMKKSGKKHADDERARSSRFNRRLLKKAAGKPRKDPLLHSGRQEHGRKIQDVALFL